jgi:hypothetical protein
MERMQVLLKMLGVILQWNPQIKFLLLLLVRIAHMGLSYPLWGDEHNLGLC